MDLADEAMRRRIELMDRQWVKDNFGVDMSTEELQKSYDDYLERYDWYADRVNEAY